MAEEDDLIRALTEPGTPSELGDEERYVAMYRDNGPTSGPPPHRGAGVVRRLGTTGTALVIAVGVAGAGAAAAYTGNLPDPLQDFAHNVLGPVAPPPAQETDRKPGSTVKAKEAAPLIPAPPTSSPSPSSSPTPSPEPTSTGSPGGPKGSGGGSPAASATPTSGASSPTAAATSPSASPSPTQEPTTPTQSPTLRPEPVPAALSVNGSTHQLDVGQTTVLSGVLSDRGGSPMPQVRVALQRRSPEGWKRIAKAVTDDAGSVSFTTPPAAETTGYRLRLGRLHSARWRVAMHPLVSLTSAEGQDESVIIGVSTQGGQPGDRVRLLLRKKNGNLVTVADAFLGADASTRFGVTPRKRHTRYVVVLEKTASHTRAHAGILVRKPGGERSD